MPRIFVIFATLLAVLSGCNHAEIANEQKGKLFIIGGGKRPAAMIRRMIDEARLDGESYMVILPMASSEPDTSAFYAALQFTGQGITNIADLRFTKDQKATPSQLDSLENAALIYITGGDQNVFMDIVAGTEVEEAIRKCYQNGGMIAGTSAGAAVMSEKMITGNQLKYTGYNETFRTIEAGNIETGKGLGLITTAVIDQHFVWRSRHNRLITAVIEYPQLIGIGIDEATAILVAGKTAEVVGESQVLIYKHPSLTSATSDNGKLGAKSLTLHVLLPGETFHLYQ